MGIGRDGSGGLFVEKTHPIDSGTNHMGAAAKSFLAKGVRFFMMKSGILHPALNRILSETGHTDILTICDRGFPVPFGPERLDLALVDDIPTVIDVLSAIDAQFHIDRILITEEMEQISPRRAEELRQRFAHLRFDVVSHQRFKEICQESRAVIRTGDTVPYANIMIVSG
jgi:D-ribose pyranase